MFLLLLFAGCSDTGNSFDTGWLSTRSEAVQQEEVDSACTCGRIFCPFVAFL